jgi:tetratricopeptide (TPR) repeat protein
MKRIFLMIAFTILCTTGRAYASKNLDQYVNTANKYLENNQLDEAIAVMEEAVEAYPESSEAYTQLGIMLGEKAQRMWDYNAMFEVIGRIFTLWDKALELDENNHTARFHRGAWAINIPKIFGRLDQGIGDFELLTTLFENAPVPELQAQLISAYGLLATGYQKKGLYEDAKRTWRKIIELAAGTEHAENAQVHIERIAVVEDWLLEQEEKKKPKTTDLAKLEEMAKKNPHDAQVLVALGEQYNAEQRYEQAATTLEKALRIDSFNVAALKSRALALQQIATHGYDPRINLDTDFLTDIAFQILDALDRAVEIADDDVELLFWRGIAGVEMPFFVGKLEQSIEDLKIVASSGAPDDVISEALYYLGYAYRKKAMTQWIQVVSRYPNSRAATGVFEQLHPDVKRIDPAQYRKPYAIIDFVIGFRDELPPQTAVWIEAKDGTFVRTIYVSGFSGHAQHEQVNLPMYSHASNFIDVDAVTGASIDLGHHIYVWDLKDLQGKKIEKGKYLVRVEVAFWPSMQYQLAELEVAVGEKETRFVREEGNFIPYLEVKYVK